MSIRKPRTRICLQLKILRRQSAAQQPFWQIIPYETDNMAETVASALTRINESGTCRDSQGRPVTKIVWEHSCLQKKCGACAMVIAGRPQLACEVFLRGFRNGKTVTIEPLRKFPIIADLQCDRSILFENLGTMQLWGQEDHAQIQTDPERSYDAARCLQCGCCLEVCPNVAVGERFFGAASFVPAARLLSTLPEEDQTAVRRAYAQHCYQDCGKSLACHAICPAGIDIRRLLLHTNAVVFRGLPH